MHRISSNFIDNLKVDPLSFDEAVSDREPQWTLDNGFDSSVYMDDFIYPFRTYHSSLTFESAAIIINIRKNRKGFVPYCTIESDYKYKLLLHTPNEIPNFEHHNHGIFVPLGKDVMVTVTPHLISTSLGLRGYNPDRRQCYCNGERSLQFFKSCTQSNCELECIAEITLRHCGCVRFSMLRKFILIEYYPMQL